MLGPRLLEQALELQSAAIVKSVLDRGVSANERVNGSYIRWGSLVMYTFPLHVATIAGNIEILNVLLSFGARVDLCDTDGNTALMLACAGNNIHAVRVLVEAGADLNLIDSNQRSALVIAAALNKTDIISLIANQGGQISERMLLRTCEISSVSAHALELLLRTS
ncbi:ankyrin repeat-containing protein [Elysia marginata]|uniref:Ankyrin repeat-containing protein n=1 Tax=Elysia marginata TaxID=1093978 RepID=A0AAV4J240_9GAST|nr:ankyrin repeat-containing protein [Elysia marginata]